MKKRALNRETVVEIQPPTKRRKRKLLHGIQSVKPNPVNQCVAKSADMNPPNIVQNSLVVSFQRLISDILNSNELSDDHICAGSQLLHAQFPNIQGLCSPVLGQRLCFPNYDEFLGYAGNSYLQVLHTGSHHWVAAEIASSSEVFIYDSLHKQQPTFYTLKQLAAILKTREPKVHLRFPRVQFQKNTVDCGVYALAFITDLSHGIDPSTRKYSPSYQLRKHLAQCFQSGHIKPFPSTPSVKKTPLTQVMNIHCFCRMPYILEHSSLRSVPIGKATEMIQCKICSLSYHHNCVNLTVEQVKKYKETSEFWMCSYNGCNEAFGDIFDTDSE